MQFYTSFTLMKISGISMFRKMAPYITSQPLTTDTYRQRTQTRSRQHHSISVVSRSSELEMSGFDSQLSCCIYDVQAAAVQGTTPRQYDTWPITSQSRSLAAPQALRLHGSFLTRAKHL